VRRRLNGSATPARLAFLPKSRSLETYEVPIGIMAGEKSGMVPNQIERVTSPAHVKPGLRPAVWRTEHEKILIKKQ
jgi:hypothetical protein